MRGQSHSPASIDMDSLKAGLLPRQGLPDAGQVFHATQPHWVVHTWWMVHTMVRCMEATLRVTRMTTAAACPSSPEVGSSTAGRVSQGGGRAG